MIETLREVRKQEYRKLWDRLPGTLGSALLIVAVAALDADPGAWIGLLIIAVLAALTRIVPATWRPIELFLDVAFYTVMNALALRVLWLLLIIDLWIVRGQGPLSTLLVLGLYVAAFLVPFLTRRLLALLTKRPVGGSQD